MSYFRFLSEDFGECAESSRVTNRPLAALRETTTERIAEVTSLRFTEVARVAVRIGRSFDISKVCLQVSDALNSIDATGKSQMMIEIS